MVKTLGGGGPMHDTELKQVCKEIFRLFIEIRQSANFCLFYGECLKPGSTIHIRLVYTITFLFTKKILIFRGENLYRI